MKTLADAITIYRTALNDLSRNGDRPPPSNVLTVLIARDDLARIIAAGGEADPGEIENVAKLDRQLKEIPVTTIVDTGTIKAWRDVVQPEPDAWWWPTADAVPINSWKTRVLSIALWIVVAAALSYVVEVLRRFFVGGVDVLSAVLQGLLALLAGSAAVQFARGLTETLSRKEKAGRGSLTIRTSYFLAGLIIISAVLLYLLLPGIARHYQDRAFDDMQKGQLTSSIQNYQRSISLMPDYAEAHYGLALAYEQVKEYDNAISEYQTAILASDTMFSAYNNLARLQMLHRHDFAMALELLNPPLVKQRDSELQRYYLYALLKNHGWANLELGNLKLAYDDLSGALSFDHDGVAARFLLGRVLEAQGDTIRARGQWMRCREILQDTSKRKEMESAWINMMEEKFR